MTDEVFSSPFFQRAVLTCLVASITAGIVGSLIVVKRLSSISGGLAHAVFGGIGIARYLGFSTMLGAFGFSALSAALLGYVYRRANDSLDTLVAILWSVGMAIGVLFVTLSPGFVGDLHSYLFGNILFVPNEYLWIVGGADVVVLLSVGMLYRSLRAIAFDEEFSEAAGVAVSPLFVLLLLLISVAVIILLWVVGILLTIALLTMPAAVARHWSRSLHGMMLGAVVLSAVSAVTGLYGSVYASAMLDASVAPGPVIILVASVFYLGSLVLCRSRI